MDSKTAGLRFYCQCTQGENCPVKWNFYDGERNIFVGEHNHIKATRLEAVLPAPTTITTAPVVTSAAGPSRNGNTHTQILFIVF